MNKLKITFGAVVAVAMVGLLNSPADARGFGFHFSGPGYHVDYGHADDHHGYRGSRHGGHHRWHGDHAWHDTSHYDYHPGEFVRHRNHYHYVPGHYDFHQTGHWDHYHW